MKPLLLFTLLWTCLLNPAAAESSLSRQQQQLLALTGIMAQKMSLIEPAMIIAQVWAESSARPDAVSPKNAIGLLQLTQIAVLDRGFSVEDFQRCQEPMVNLFIGLTFLNYLFNRYQHVLLALAAFNAGPERVDRWLKEQRFSRQPLGVSFINDIPFMETRRYLRRIVTSSIALKQCNGTAQYCLNRVFADG